MAETKDELPVVGWVDPKELQKLESGEPWTPLERENHDGISVPLTSHAAAQSRINALLEEVEGLRKDAARYNWIRHRTSAGRDIGGRVDFQLPILPGGPHLLKGSVAQHLDAAIDRSLSGGEGGGNGLR